MNDSNDAAPTTPARSLGDRLWELSQWLPYLGWSGLIAWGLSHRIPWGFALLLAPVLGIFVWFLTGQIANSGTNNLIEINIGSGFYLILALALTPVFCHARHNARSSVCLTNLKRQGLALQMYAADNDDALPPAHRWADALHLPDTTFRCPESKAAFGYTLSSAGRLQAGSTLVYEASSQRNAIDAAPSQRHDGRGGRGHNALFGDGAVRFVPAPTPTPPGPVTVGAR